MEREEDTFDKGNIVDDEDAEVFAISENANVDFSQEVCPKLLLKGQCWQRDCRFSHKAAMVHQEKEKLLQQWPKQEDQKKPSAHNQDQKSNNQCGKETTTKA